MSFSEATPAPLPAGQTTVGPSTSLPVQLGTERGTVPLPSVLAAFGSHSHSERQLSLPHCFLQPWAASPDFGTSAPAFWNNPIDPLGLAFG